MIMKEQHPVTELTETDSTRHEMMPKMVEDIKSIKIISGGIYG
jgi:hypothetical protein